MGVNASEVVALEPTAVNWRNTTALGNRNANAGEKERREDWSRQKECGWLEGYSAAVKGSLTTEQFSFTSTESYSVTTQHSGCDRVNVHSRFGSLASCKKYSCDGVTG